MKQAYLKSSAVFSDCRRWRYRLDRVWDPDRPPMAAGMLNPSSADENEADRTVSNQINRAKRGGFGALIVFNAFAFVTPSPDELKARLQAGFDVVGEETDRHAQEILTEIRDAGGRVTVGWGVDGGLAGRDRVLSSMAGRLGIQLYSLGATDNGQPRHPRGVP